MTKFSNSHKGRSKIQIRSDNREAFVVTNTLTATAGACLSLGEASWRRSWSEKVRVRNRKRSASRELYLARRVMFIIMSKPIKKQSGGEADEYI